MLRAIRLAKGLGVVTVAAAVLSLSAESVSGTGLSGGTKVIVKSGKGSSSSTSTSTSSTGNTGDCARLRLVVVAAAISNGAFENEIKAEAKCGGSVVATATATDPGDGTVDFDHTVQPLNPPSATGAPTCVRTYTEPTPGADSTWSITCVFLFL